MSFKLKNFTVEQFNRDVNSSQQPDDKFSRWSEYRNQVSGFFSKVLQQENKHGNVLVFGAGALNDIDLPWLCEWFSQVVLADIDTASIRQGIRRHRLTATQADRIELLQLDFSGAQEYRLFPRLESLVRHAAPAEKIIAELADTIAAMKPGSIPDGRKFDCVISCPVYTQLVYTQIEVLLKILYTYEQYSYEDLNRILTAAHQGMPVPIRNYNRMLMAALKDEGNLIVLSDILEIAIDDPFLEKVRIGLTVAEIDKMIERKIEDEGLDFARAGLEDLQDKVDRTDFLYIIWPFDEHKEYLVYGLAGKMKFCL